MTLGHFPEAEAGSFAVDGANPDSCSEQLQASGALAEGWKVFVVMVVGGGGRRYVHEVLNTPPPRSSPPPPRPLEGYVRV